MAATDARPVPRKNTAYRLPLAIRKNDGTLITTWAGQDSKVSLDGEAFADCTNEATEIGTSGCGYIDLTAGEMNADSVIVKITVTNTDALPVVIVLYPEEAGDMRSDVTHWKGSAAPDNTGDAYARLGAPAGASIAADLLVLKGYVDCLPETWVVPAATGDAMTLTSGERTTLAAAIEAAIINELDGTAVMQAIADLIASDMTTTDLTVAAIATACRDAILNRVLSGNHDTAGTPGKLLQNCDAPISDVPTVAEFEARTVPAASIATSMQTAAILDAVGVVDTVVDAIKAKTDGLNFTGTDVKATLDGEEVTPTAASKTGYSLTTAPPTAGEIADAVLDETIAEHANAGSVGQAISAAGGAADPLLNPVPGAYAEGTAGYVIGTNLDAKVSEAGGSGSVHVTSESVNITSERDT